MTAVCACAHATPLCLWLAHAEAHAQASLLCSGWPACCRAEWHGLCWRAPWMAAPMATTSSGFTPREGSLPKMPFTISCTWGRVWGAMVRVWEKGLGRQGQ